MLAAHLCSAVSNQYTFFPTLQKFKTYNAVNLRAWTIESKNLVVYGNSIEIFFFQIRIPNYKPPIIVLYNPARKVYIHRLLLQGKHRCWWMTILCLHHDTNDETFANYHISIWCPRRIWYLTYRTYLKLHAYPSVLGEKWLFLLVKYGINF